MKMLGANRGEWKMKAKELSDYLLQYPEAEIMFCNDPNYPPAYPGEEFVNMESVNLDSFEFEVERNVIILPNLCRCYPEPD